ncbi:hypothetical protein EI555_012581 [Monodon monoceros]|uniref:EF-1-gamma C-terminal domain-containing protein n=1 Tax=Monodon monoceros TaxID=40151 RepID=A0A4U1FQB9_MONMO|nr:hypothetical protein EI555_012581 [Monodon monoceros]
MVPANFSVNFLLARFQPLRLTMDSVFESNAIAYYVSNEELRGSTPEAAAQVVQWVSFADSDIVPPASTWVFPSLGIMHHNKQATENAKEERKHSKEDTFSMALPYFGEHFDKNDWSLWYSEYRFPEELIQAFMSCNLITGMFQRLDKLRKNASVGVMLFGTNNSSSISGSSEARSLPFR